MGLKGVLEKRGKKDLLDQQVYQISTCGGTLLRNGLPSRCDGEDSAFIFFRAVFTVEYVDFLFLITCTYSTVFENLDNIRANVDHKVLNSIDKI